MEAIVNRKDVDFGERTDGIHIVYEQYLRKADPR